MIVWLYVAEWDAYVLVIYKGCLKTYQGFHNTSTAYALYRHRGFTSLNNLKLTHNVHEFIECLQIRRSFFTQYITSLRRQCVYSHQQSNGDDRCTRRGVKLCGVSNPIHEWIYGFNCLYHWQSEDQIACWKIFVIQHSSCSLRTSCTSILCMYSSTPQIIWNHFQTTSLKIVLYCAGYWI